MNMPTLDPAAVRRWKRYPEYQSSRAEWLPQLPARWQTKRLKYLAMPSRQRLFEKPQDATYIGLEQIESKTGKLLLGNPVETVESNMGVFDAGDILFGKLRPYLAKVTAPPFAGVCSTELTVYRPTREIRSEYLKYQMLVGDFIDFVNSLAYGTKMPRVNEEQLSELRLAVPPLPEQRAIAAFLDRETACIDALIGHKERLIALLEEKRQAVISHAVTRGLDPAVPLKDSGVPWLGMVPKHWRTLALRRVVTKFVDYRGATPKKVDEGTRLVTASNVRDGMIDYAVSEEFISEEDYLPWMVRGFPAIGDVLLTTEAPLGETAMVDNDKIALAQRVILFKVNHARMTNDFLCLYFQSAAGKGELWSRATGSTAIGIKASHLKGISVLVPPLSEQQAIIHLVSRITSTVRSATRPIRDGIARLREYRTALISATVTGQIDVRGEVTL
jgi:type I restriction enzyme S subunit